MKIARLSRVALLVNPDSQISPGYIDATYGAAAAPGLAIQMYEARSLSELELYGGQVLP